eukprot:5339091-Lingulodinium_polyedra.AAC.1
MQSTRVKRTRTHAKRTHTHARGTRAAAVRVARRARQMPPAGSARAEFERGAQTRAYAGGVRIGQ